MTTIELQQWRESFIERYLNKIDDMETVLKIEKYMKRIMSKANAADLRGQAPAAEQDPPLCGKTLKFLRFGIQPF